MLKSRMSSKIPAQPKSLLSNIMKEEVKALHNLGKDDINMVLTADKGVPLVITEAQILINAWPYLNM